MARPLPRADLPRQLAPFASTQSFIRDVLAIHRESPVSSHLEVETYTWDVLPEPFRSGSVDEAVARELAWVRAGAERMNLALALRLGRISNLPTVWTNVLVGCRARRRPARRPSLAALMLALSLFYVGGMFLNDAFDRDFDAEHRPERPIPSGQVSAQQVFSFGFGLLVAGVALVAWRAAAPTASRPGGDRGERGADRRDRASTTRTTRAIRSAR